MRGVRYLSSDVSSVGYKRTRDATENELSFYQYSVVDNGIESFEDLLELIREEQREMREEHRKMKEAMEGMIVKSTREVMQKIDSVSRNRNVN